MLNVSASHWITKLLTDRPVTPSPPIHRPLPDLQAPPTPKSVLNTPKTLTLKMATEIFVETLKHVTLVSSGHEEATGTSLRP